MEVVEGTAADLGTVQVELTAFAFAIAARRTIDLTRAPFRAFEEEISSPVSYAASQPLGAQMRGAGVEACLYVSARARGRSVNLAVFENVFAPGGPSREERWTCWATRARVEFRSQRMIGAEQRHAFDRAQFEVNGALPAPAIN